MLDQTALISIRAAYVEQITDKVLPQKRGATKQKCGHKHTQAVRYWETFNFEGLVLLPAT